MIGIDHKQRGRQETQMIDDCWEKLIALKTELRMWPDRGEGLAALADERAVFEVYLDDIEQDMFILAANRMADLVGIETLRVDIEDGMPQFIMSFGTTVENARARMTRYYEARGQEMDVHDD